MSRVTGALLAVCSLTACAAGTAAAQEPGDPVVAGAPGGVYAVAVPGLAGSPALAGGFVTFAVEDVERERLFQVAAASALGWRTLFRASPGPRVTVDAIAGSASQVVMVRHRPGRLQSCDVGGDCTPSPDDVLAGAPAGALRRVFGFTERLPPRGACRRRIAQLEGDVSLSGDRIAYARRVRCMAPRRPGRPQVVVRDLRSGAVRVVHRGEAYRVLLAGRYLAFEPGRARQLVVMNLRSGRAAYRVHIGDGTDYFLLDADGTLVRTLFPERSGTTVGRLGWYSPSSPRLHRMPNRVAVFSGPPLVYAAGMIAYVSRYDDDGATLSVTDLNGRSRDFASFQAPEQLESFTFDGARLAFAHTRYRPYQGAADNGLQAICDDERAFVQATAPVLEVHPVTVPGRLPLTSLPSAAPYRTPDAERPDCRYDD